MPKKEKVHYIYKIHFLCGFPTGRYYLGKHHGYVDDTYAGSGEFGRRYYKKYGKVKGITYIKEILEINPDVEINRIREIEIIGDLWKTDPLCMNLKPGGDGNDTLSKENKEALSNAKKKPIIQYTLNGEFLNEFDSVKTASALTNTCSAKISSCCTKSRLTAGGFIWRYVGDSISKDELDFIKSNTKQKEAAKRKVCRIDINTGERVYYESMREAARQIGGHNSSINAVCHGKRKTANGYKWEFVED